MTDPPADWKLLAACKGNDGNVFYVLASPGNAGDGETSIEMTLYRASMSDGRIWR